MDRSSSQLRATEFLDYETPAVRAFVANAMRGAASEVERASRLFRAVRDDIRYDPYQSALDPRELTASATLGRGAAFCVPKAILFAACLRAVGIPTRLGFADVTNHLATRKLLESLRTRVFAFHGFVEVHLAGRVVKATPAFNASLCEKFGVAPLEFDGEHDAMLQSSDSAGHAFMKYIRDRGTYDDFPYPVMIEAWRETYPHLFGLPPRPQIAFEDEVARERT
jgi:transglutaminase-like putative cysteine protease